MQAVVADAGTWKPNPSLNRARTRAGAGTRLRAATRPLPSTPCAIARLTHDDAPTRQRKADTAVADVEVQRTLAMSEQQKAVEFAEQSRSDVLAAYDA